MYHIFHNKLHALNAANVFDEAKVVALNLQHLVLNILLDVLIGQVPATGAAALHVYNAAYKGQLN